MKKEEKNYNKKIILITGTGGHLGSFLLDRILKKKYKIFSIEKEKPTKKIKNVTSLIVDISKINELAKYKKIFAKTDILIHLAAYVPLEGKLDDFNKSLNINIKGSVNLANFLKDGSKFIFANTCEIYNPQTFYAISKLTAEKYLKVICKKRNIKFISLRFASMYGPGEKIKRAIPNFIKAAIKNEDIFIFGAGKEKRSYLYIEDAVQAILRTIDYSQNGIFNISSEEVTTILDSAKLIRKIAESKSKIIFGTRKKEKKNLVFSIKKAKKELEFKPKFKLKDGFKKEIEHFRKYE